MEITPYIFPEVADQACTVAKILRFAELNDLVITTNENFVRTCIAVFIIGAFVGIACWEVGKYMYHYGKHCATDKP